MYILFGVFVVSCVIGVPVSMLLCANCMTEKTRQHWIFFFYYDREELEIRSEMKW